MDKKTVEADALMQRQGGTPTDLTNLTLNCLCNIMS